MQCVQQSKAIKAKRTTNRELNTKFAAFSLQNANMIPAWFKLQTNFHYENVVLGAADGFCMC